MLYYDTINVSEETDVNEASAWKECDICHYRYFVNYSFMFQSNVCIRCHDLLMPSINLSDIAILNIKGCDYGCIISLISKNWAMKYDAKCWFNWKKWNIIKHEKCIFIYKNG